MRRLLGGREPGEAHGVSPELERLPLLQRRLALDLADGRRRDADRDQDHAEVDDEAAVAPVVLGEEPADGRRPGLAGRAAAAPGGPPELSQHDGGDEVRERVAEAHQPERKSAGQPRQEARAEGDERRAPGPGVRGPPTIRAARGPAGPLPSAGA